MKRYKQRLKEYSDNFRDMKKLKDQGLVTVEDGVVIDRGLSNTRLGKNGKLIVDRKGPAGGTGKGFTGDHDMWDITHPDGRPIITDPGAEGFDAAALRRKNSLQDTLDRGLAQTQHGPHKDWIPITKRDIGIDKKIRAGHNPGGEALLEFSPNKPPRTSYEIGGMPREIVGGMPKIGGMPRENVGGMPKGKVGGMPRELDEAGKELKTGKPSQNEILPPRGDDAFGSATIPPPKDTPAGGSAAARLDTPPKIDSAPAGG